MFLSGGLQVTLFIACPSTIGIEGLVGKMPAPVAKTLLGLIGRILGKMYADPALYLQMTFTIISILINQQAL